MSDDVRPASVGYTRDGAVAILTVDNPPVNALSAAVRGGLLDGIRRAEGDPSVAATVIACAGRTFVAGADIREFGKPPIEPALPVVLAAIENAVKPTVAAIHGTALGGGFELALACHRRVALADARVGLPEIRLGVIPGGGGTQRLPRLVGVERALDMILSGAPVTAEIAAAWGAVDEIVTRDDDLIDVAVAHARTMIAQEAPAMRTRDRDAALLRDGVAHLTDRHAALAASDPEEVAGLAAIEAMAIGIEHGFDAGLSAERAAFVALRDSPRAAAKREAFFAARRKPSP